MHRRKSQTSLARTLPYFLGGALALAFFGAAALLESRGILFGSRFTLLKAATLEVTGDRTGEKIFFDHIKRGEVSREDETVRVGNIAPGEHSVIVAKDDFWPYYKTLSFGEGETVHLSALLLPKNTTGFVVGEKDPEYENIVEGIEGARLPERIAGFDFDPFSPSLWVTRAIDRQKFSDDKKTAVWVEGNTLYAVWINENDARLPDTWCTAGLCRKPLKVFRAKERIDEVDFYKGRNDAVILETGGAVYAIEFDARGTQNFEPVFIGKNPRFWKKNNGEFFVRDGESVFEVHL